MKRGVSLLVCIYLSVLCLSAQNTRFEDYSVLLSPEKVYIQTDREVYNIGDTIWFRGYLENVSYLAKYAECNYIYVELVSAKWEKNAYKKVSEERFSIRKRIKVKRNDDGIVGYIPLTEDLNTGIATLRAYSYWMLNGDPSYMFNKNIELRNPMKDDFVNTLLMAEYSNQQTYDEIGVQNPFRKEILKKKPKTEEGIDLQFLPESGRYLPDRPSVMAVKAVNADGLGAKVSGEVFADGVSVASFSTNDLGMGSFIVSVPAGTKSLTAVAETPVEGFQFEGSLPLPEARAVIINVIPDTLGVSIAVADAGISLPPSASLIVYDRTEIVFQSPYSECAAGKRVAYADLRPGINNLAVIDDQGNVYAERPFFVFPAGKIFCDFAFDKPSYGKREKVSVTVSLHDEDGHPVDGSFSLAVTDEDYAPYSGEGHSIVSWMLLGCELKGLVEKPQRYFNDSIPLSQRIADIDALLLTQGWRYYDLEKILKGKTPAPVYGKEYTQSLSGYVNGVIGKSKHATLCFMAPSIDFSMIADLDSTAYFALNGLDFPDSTQFIVGAQGKGKLLKKMYTPILNPEYFAADFTYPNYLKTAGYSDEYAQFAMQSYYATDGTLTYTLAPARIVAQKPHLSPYPNDSFKTGEYRDEAQLLPYAAYDAISYIAETCPGVYYHDGLLSGSPYFISSHMQMKKIYPPINIYVNGFKVSQGEIAGLMMSEVDAFAYVRGIAAAKYDDAYRQSQSASFIHGATPAVFLSTRVPLRYAPNVTADRPLGWQRPAKFYTPKYESAASKKAFEPMRATLHWEPNLIFENGEARFEFWTSDHQAPCRIILEGVADTNRALSFQNYFTIFALRDFRNTNTTKQ